MHPHTLLLAIAGTSAALPAAPATNHLTSAGLIPSTGLGDMPTTQPSHPYEDLNTGGTDKFDVGAAGRKNKPAATTAFQDSSKDADKLETPRKKLNLPAIEAAAHLEQRGEPDGIQEEIPYGSHVPYGVSPEEEELYEDIVSGKADKSSRATTTAGFGFVPLPEAAPEAEKREEVGDFKDDPFSGDHAYEVSPEEENLYEEIITGGADKFKGATFRAMLSPEDREVEKREEVDDDEYDDFKYDGFKDDDFEDDDFEDDDFEDDDFEGDDFEGDHDDHPQEFEGQDTYGVHPDEEELYEDLVTGEDDAKFDSTKKTDAGPKKGQ